VRLPRFFGKKRGDRRTGSPALASVGDAAFHAALLLGGLVFGSLLASGVAVPEWRMNHDYLPARCTIVATGLARRDPTGGGRDQASTWQPCLRVRYETPAGMRESWCLPRRPPPTPDRESARAQLSAWHLGHDLPCWFDPADPVTVVIERGYNWPLWLLGLLLPGALVAFGGSGLARALNRWGRSEERQAVSARLTRLLDPLGGPPATADAHPGVPACDDMINSPGTVLRYRLPIESPESWTLVGFGLFALLWNTVLVVLAVNAGIDLLGGRTDWLLLALLVPFAAVGIGGIVVFARSLIVASAVGTTQLEISAHPLEPGGSYELLLAQAGSGAFASLSMDLELEEQATFRQGTDTRTEKVTVLRQPVASWHHLQLAPGTRFEAPARLAIPPQAMHSFGSEHNAVRWSIVVRGTPDRWPPFVRVFPLVVHPSAGAAPPASAAAEAIP